MNIEHAPLKNVFLAEPMTKVQSDALQMCEGELIQKLNPKTIYPELIEKDVLSENEKDMVIKDGAGSRELEVKELVALLQKKRQCDFFMFVSCIQLHHEDIASRLTEYSRGKIYG